MNIFVIVDQKNPPWYSFLIIGLLAPILGFVVYRIFIRYKVLRFGNNQVEIRLPVLRHQKAYPINQIDYWQENKVKTGKTSSYRELEIKFSDGEKISIGYQEYSDYERIVKYLQQKSSKKRRN